MALKILKTGMDTREVVARFEVERQALAVMDHPGIATVFDAGTTAAGRPYSVMELVQRVPLTRFCETEQLTIPEHLKLFMEVCVRFITPTRKESSIGISNPPTSSSSALMAGKAEAWTSGA